MFVIFRCLSSDFLCVNKIVNTLLKKINWDELAVDEVMNLPPTSNHFFVLVKDSIIMHYYKVSLGER
jgi:hypothetical protein